MINDFDDTDVVGTMLSDAEQPNDEEMSNPKDMFPEIGRMMALGIPEAIAEEIAFNRYEAKYNNLYLTTYQGTDGECCDFYDKDGMLKRLGIDIADNFFNKDYAIKNVFVDGKEYKPSMEIFAHLESNADAIIQIIEHGYMTDELNKDINAGKFIIVVGKNCIVRDEQMVVEEVIDRIGLISDLLTAGDASVYVFFKGLSVIYDWKIKLQKI
jgi:hypothetical protein